MNRRVFFGLLAGLVAAPFLPKKKAETVKIALSELPVHTSGFLQAETPGFPSGMLQSWSGNSVPPGWLACNGQLISQETYPALFETIGTLYGKDSPGNFRVPDLRDRENLIRLPDYSTQFIIKT